jgi:hypothetical protein
MGAQEIIVLVIGCAVVAYIAARLRRLAVRKKDPCAGCPGCDKPSSRHAEKQEKCGPGG